MDVSRKSENIVKHMQTYGSRIPWASIASDWYKKCKSHQQLRSAGRKETENKKGML